MKKIALIGYGRIGKAIDQMLTKQGYIVNPYDSQVDLGPTVRKLDPTFFGLQLAEIAESHDAIIAATPHHLNLMIAEACVNYQTAYFDLTEDTQVSFDIQQLAKNSRHKNTWLMPQCGLAPGAISIIANNLTKDFDDIENVYLRVGDLPITTNNKLKYSLTWSTQGLINEYSQPCNALVNCKKVTVQPLEGIEEINIDGMSYEAFNTSGGIGSLIQTLGHRARNIDYKTIRYHGHRDLMAFLLQDLQMQNDQSLLVKLFDQSIPHTTQDVVLIFIQVTGWKKKKYIEETYVKKIYANNQMTAIQRTTAAGLCTAVHYWATVYKKKDCHETIIRNEIITEEDLVDNPFWDLYR